MNPRQKMFPWLLLLFVAAPANANIPYDIARKDSLFVVVIHPAGAVAELGHHHVIAAMEYEADLRINENPFTPGSYLTLSVPIAGLDIDPQIVIAGVVPRLLELGIVDRSIPAPIRRRQGDHGGADGFA